MFLAFTALSLFFLLKDGPRIRAWGERHLGVPPPVASTIIGRVTAALRGYFAGVTAVAAFNALVIGLGALVLGVPLAGSIAVINFAGAYIPYVGAWTAGIFTVLIALGAERNRDRGCDGRDRPAGQRHPSADRPADRLRGDARHSSHSRS